MAQRCQGKSSLPQEMFNSVLHSLEPVGYTWDPSFKAFPRGTRTLRSEDDSEGSCGSRLRLTPYARSPLGSNVGVGSGGRVCAGPLALCWPTLPESQQQLICFHRKLKLWGEFLLSLLGLHEEGSS